MSGTVIRHSPGYQVGRTSDGRDLHPIGQPFATPRDAIAYSDQLDGQGAPETPQDVPDGDPRSEAGFSGALWPSEREP